MKLKNALFVAILFASPACADDDDPSGPSTNNQQNNGHQANNQANNQNEPDWSYRVTSNPSDDDFPEGEGGTISITPSGSPDAPAQLTLSNAVPLFAINFYVETDDGSLPPGTYEVLSFLWQTPDQVCGDAGGQSPSQMTLVVDSEDPPQGSFSGSVTCNSGSEDAYDVEVEGTFDDS